MFVSIIGVISVICGKLCQWDDGNFGEIGLGRTIILVELITGSLDPCLQKFFILLILCSKRCLKLEMIFSAFNSRDMFWISAYIGNVLDLLRIDLHTNTKCKTVHCEVPIQFTQKLPKIQSQSNISQITEREQ